MKIYTKKGDKGQTFLANGKRVSKADLRVEVEGTIDELNSLMGIAVAEVSSIKYPHFAKVFDPEASDRRASRGRQVLSIKEELLKVQNDLFNIGAELASSNTKSKPSISVRLRSLQALRTRAYNTKYLTQRVGEIEKVIDFLQEKLPKLNRFILPGGGKGGSFLHFARAVARRAERRVVELSKKEKIDKNILIYLNRLSDLLFIMARFVNYKEGKKEIVWPSEALVKEGKSKK